MSVKLECERCGAQEETSGVMLFAGLTGPAIPTARPELPAGWTRPKLPREDGSAWYTDLCPQCKADLFRFMAGQPVIDDLRDVVRAMRVASPQVCRACGHKAHGGTTCRELTMPGPPGDVDECGCTGVADAVCPTCGPMPLEPHPRRPGIQRCSNCKEHRSVAALPDRMKELGIDD